MIDTTKIRNIADVIVKICSPLKIYLISNKVNISGEVTSFKLCLIVADSVHSVSELECHLYMTIDSDIPFDLVIYKESEWNDLKDDIGTFAWKINNTGTLLYE
jgi:hypothetical protein